MIDWRQRRRRIDDDRYSPRVGDLDDRLERQRARAGIAGIVTDHRRRSLGDRALQLPGSSAVRHADLDDLAAADAVGLVIVEPVDRCMTSSFAMPLLSGKRAIRSGSVPAMQAAAASAIAAQEPARARSPASAPVIFGDLLADFGVELLDDDERLRCLAIAAAVSGRISVPPTRVAAPAPLITVRIPIRL